MSSPVFPHENTETPWHLIPQDIRERSAIANLESDAGDGHTCGQVYTNDPCDCDIRTAAFRAAAELLRDAAPYPDEALVCKWFDQHVELLDFVNDPNLVRVMTPGGARIAISCVSLVPLTLGAVEFLDLAVRSRTP